MRLLLPPRRLAALAALAALSVAPACATLSARPQREDLSGPWTMELDVAPQRVTRGAFTLERAGDGYTGVLTTEIGTERLPVRSFTVDRDSVTMQVVSPQGLVVFRGVLDAPRSTMSGMVTYHTGALFPMRARRGT